MSIAIRLNRAARTNHIPVRLERESFVRVVRVHPWIGNIPHWQTEFVSATQEEA
ncbi:MAG: hypothetical protein QY310_12455 [Candidatus Jettenia sp. CY-1]|nr:MAG: hypothetical protein QY310_12455 [Candidatus Jettenia sp. CY-1]